MVTPTQVELDYLANVTGTTQAALHSAIAAVPLDFPTIEALGLSVISDTTTNIGATQVKRAVILSLVFPDFISVANPPPVVPWTGSIVSTSKLDGVGGTGLLIATVHYLDPAGGAHTEAVALNGRTPVKMVNANKSQVTSVDFTVTGAFNGNVGLITILGDPELLAPEELIQVPVIGTIGQNYSFYFPVVLSDQRDPVRNLLTSVLQFGAETPVIALAPVLS